jgi:enoyl-CoA hydratase/carnithine racemase
MRAPDGEFVRCQVDDGIAVVTIERPPVNAFSSAVYAELARAMETIGTDDGVRVAILTAEGRMFSAGADVKELSTLAAGGRAAFFAQSDRTRRLVSDLPVPMIAAINGSAVGAGVAYATYCDYRLASESAFFAMPEIDRGSVAGGGLPLVAIGVAPGALRWMLYSGARIPAVDALAIHLVDEVVPPEELMIVARERAAVIAAKARSTLVAMKRAILDVGRDPRWEGAHAAAQATTIALADHPETREGFRTFLEHRED